MKRSVEIYKDKEGILRELIKDKENENWNLTLPENSNTIGPIWKYPEFMFAFWHSKRIEITKIL